MSHFLLKNKSCCCISKMFFILFFLLLTNDAMPIGEKEETEPWVGKIQCDFKCRGGDTRYGGEVMCHPRLHPERKVLCDDDEIPNFLNPIIEWSLGDLCELDCRDKQEENCLEMQKKYCVPPYDVCDDDEKTIRIIEVVFYEKDLMLFK